MYRRALFMIMCGKHSILYPQCLDIFETDVVNIELELKPINTEILYATIILQHVTSER